MQAESSIRSDEIVICDILIYGKCRCCLALGNHQYNFGKAELEMLMENLNLFLMADPRLPHLLCSDCVTSLNEAIRFRQKVIASESELRRAMTEEIKPVSENVPPSQDDPLEIYHLKSEHDYQKPLLVTSTTANDTAGTKHCKIIKIEFEPCGQSSRDTKSKTTVKTENESNSSNKTCVERKEKEPVKLRKLHTVPQTSKGSRTVPQSSKGSRMAPQTNKRLRLVPLNSKDLQVPYSSKGLHLVPIGSKGLRLIPVNSKGIPHSNKGLRLVSVNSKSLQMAPQSSKRLRLVPQSSKGSQLVPQSSKGSRVVSQSSTELCEEPLEDVATTNIKNESDVTISKENRKRKIKDDETHTASENKKDDSDSETLKSQTKEEKIDRRSAMLASIETARHLLLKDNSKVRSNIILILKHSTILPFRNNFKFAFKCFYCDKLYIPFKELKEHIQTEHTDVSEKDITKIVRSMQNLIVTADISCIKCRLCDQQCESIEKLIEHLCEVHEKVYHETDRKPSHGILGVDLSTDTLKCHICNLDHTFFKNLLVHMNEHYGVFVCYVCGKKFLSERRYKSHVISTHDNKEIKCKQCSKVFKTEPAMKYHVKRVHLKTRVKCLYCPETFTSGNYVKRLNHMADVHGITKPKFKCDICNKELANSASLAHHKMYTHKRTNVNTCELCGYMTCSNSAMKNHMIVHSGEKNFECEFCKKTFAKQGTLKLHLKIHFNDKRFVCVLCDAAFIQKNSLKNHMHSKHPDSGVDVNNLSFHEFNK